MPRLRVLAGESPQSLKPIPANKYGGYELKTSTFEGEISVFLKNHVNEEGEISSGADYFDSPSRKGCTWSIQARGAHSPTLITFGGNLGPSDVMNGDACSRSVSQRVQRRQRALWEHF